MAAVIVCRIDKYISIFTVVCVLIPCVGVSLPCGCPYVGKAKSDFFIGQYLWQPSALCRIIIFIPHLQPK